MEARRRLGILSSHIWPESYSTTSANHRATGTTALSAISPSDCDSRCDGEESNPEIDCVFCKIVRGEAPAMKLYEDDKCLCILDTNPVSHGHSLIIPRCHFPSFAATPPSMIAAMCSRVPYISNAVIKAAGCDSFNLLVNNGAAAGQVIFHTHMHIIPRKARDCLWASESLQRRPLKIDPKTLHFVDIVREQLSFLDNFEDSKNHGSTLIGS